AAARVSDTGGCRLRRGGRRVLRRRQGGRQPAHEGRVDRARRCDLPEDRGRAGRDRRQDRRDPVAQLQGRLQEVRGRRRGQRCRDARRLRPPARTAAAGRRRGRGGRVALRRERDARDLRRPHRRGAQGQPQAAGEGDPGGPADRRRAGDPRRSARAGRLPHGLL
ncbi:MAG: hypothetical protein AVDCRST_MAG67-1817, partial [uncultured Solirubrobacteraceae bacterium]